MNPKCPMVKTKPTQLHIRPMTVGIRCFNKLKRDSTMFDAHVLHYRWQMGSNLWYQKLVTLLSKKKKKKKKKNTWDFE